MRLALALLLASSPAIAGSHKDDSPKPGRLGNVSSGIDRASSPKPSPTRSDSRSDSRHETTTDTTVVVVDDCCYEGSPEPPRKPYVWPKVDVAATGFAGAQKVVESDGALTAELSVMFNRTFRLNGAVTHYFERSDREVSMNVPSFTLGVRVVGNRSTRLWLEGGVVHVATNDPAGSSSLTGSLMNARLEHRFDDDTSLVVTGGAMLFSELQAMTARAALRIHHVELGVRYVDFKDTMQSGALPPLWGPEVGIGF